MLDMIYVLMMMVFVLIFLGFYFKEYPLTFLGSMFSMILGIYIATNGLTGINNWITQTVAVIFVGVGMYILGRGSIEIIKNKF